MHVLLQVYLTTDGQYDFTADSKDSDLAESPVPVVCDVAAIHDLPKQVAQVFPWYAVVGFQIVVQHIHTDNQIPSVERVRSVPTLWPKLSSFSNNCMEVTQRKKNALELSFL